MQMSEADLFSVSIFPNPVYTCRPHVENAEHFFFKSSHCDNQITQLMAPLINIIHITLRLLFFLHTNQTVLFSVLRHLKQTDPFSI